ncbi:hypothetical protein BOO86_21775 [Mycobacterium sp. CBMA 234]|nr:hypothetical protein [Mycolicibacterium sp. CBMA 234]
MAIRPETHRAAGQARRVALLEAAIEVIAESGVDAATHRAITAKAKMPLSTTSYFFTSIDELIAEAIQMTATRLITTLDGVLEEITDADLTPDEIVDRCVDLIIALPTTYLAAEFQIYIQCSHRPELQAGAHHMMSTFERIAGSILRQAGADDPRLVRPLVALIDGFALQRFAWPRGESDRKELADGIRGLFRVYAPVSTASD